MASKYRALAAVRARRAALKAQAQVQVPSVRNLVQKMPLNLSKASAAAFKANGQGQDFSLELPVSALRLPGKREQLKCRPYLILRIFPFSPF